jgi:hypothetical protein
MAWMLLNTKVTHPEEPQNQNLGPILIEALLNNVFTYFFYIRKQKSILRAQIVMIRVLSIQDCRNLNNK